MMDIRGSDGVLRTPDEHYDTPRDVEQDPYGAHLAIHLQADEITALRAQLADAEADKLEAMQRVLEAAAGMCDEVVRAIGAAPTSSIHSALSEYRRGILSLDIDALAEGEKE